jgi:flavin reductase (DIM6/NTAB) family NADH-FMN oxidoreductase RutF
MGAHARTAVDPQPGGGDGNRSEAEPAVRPERFKDSLAAVAAPVSVVTALKRGRPHGTTVSSFCSLSLRPPLVLVSLARDSALLRLLPTTERFAINVLAAGQEDLARRFARKGSDKFDGVGWRLDHRLPRLPDCRGFIACRLERLVEGGDHMVAIGLVVHAERAPRPPLVYCERAFATVPWEGE